MSTDTPIKLRPLALLISLLITLGIGITASLVTRPQIPSWYATLHKPSFSPPNWLFAPVWITIYILIAIAAYMVWQRRQQTPAYNTTRWLYITQLVLNFSWSIVFFGMHQVLSALAVIGLLWLSIVANIYLFGKFSRVAAWLLVPYLLWVSFASGLNLYIYLLN